MFSKKFTKTYVVMFFIFSTAFYFGVFANPNFNIHEFCMGLSTEILGLVIALTVVDRYMREKEKASEAKKETGSKQE